MKKTRVLIADDSEKLISALQVQLEVHGFDVITCTDAYMALAHAQKQRPDVMILDIRMPAGNGFSVLERMRKLPELRGIPVIYITGDQSSSLDFQAEQLGACGLIHKPISFPILLQMIDSAVQRVFRQDADSREPLEEHIFNISADPNPSEIPGVKL